MFFWVGTSEGLVRYSPSLWQVPPRLMSLNEPVHAIKSSYNESEILWAAGQTRLVKWDGHQWLYYAYPSAMDLNFLPTDSIYCMPNGDVLDFGWQTVSGVSSHTGPF